MFHVVVIPPLSGYRKWMRDGEIFFFAFPPGYAKFAAFVSRLELLLAGGIESGRVELGRVESCRVESGRVESGRVESGHDYPSRTDP